MCRFGIAGGRVVRGGAPTALTMRKVRGKFAASTISCGGDRPPAPPPRPRAAEEPRDFGRSPFALLKPALTGRFLLRVLRL